MKKWDTKVTHSADLNRSTQTWPEENGTKKLVPVKIRGNAPCNHHCIQPLAELYRQWAQPCPSSCRRVSWRTGNITRPPCPPSRAWSPDHGALEPSPPTWGRLPPAPCARTAAPWPGLGGVSQVYTWCKKVNTSALTSPPPHQDSTKQFGPDINSPALGPRPQASRSQRGCSWQPEAPSSHHSALLRASKTHDSPCTVGAR